MNIAKDAENKRVNALKQELSAAQRNKGTADKAAKKAVTVSQTRKLIWICEVIAVLVELVRKFISDAALYAKETGEIPATLATFPCWRLITSHALAIIKHFLPNFLL